MSRFPVAFPLPAFASRSSDSRRGIGPSSRSAYRPKAGPRRGSRVPHARAAPGVGALCAPRTAVLFPAEARSQPAPAALLRLVPSPRHDVPPCEALLHEASTKGLRSSPVRASPRPRPRGGTGSASAFPLSFAPRRHRQRASGAGTGHRARARNYSLNITSLDPPVGSSLVSCDFASHRAMQVARSVGKVRVAAQKEVSVSTTRSSFSHPPADGGVRRESRRS